MEPTITADEVKQILLDHDTTYVYLRDCSICNYPLAYIIYNPDYNAVLFDAGCHCVGERRYRESSYEALANHYNIQSNQEVKDEYMKQLKSGAQFC